MTTYPITWSINGIQVKPQEGSLTDVVYEVSFKLLKTDNAGHMAENGGMVVLSSPDPSNFTPFADLTEAEVVAWVKATLNAAKQEALAAENAKRAAEGGELISSDTTAVQDFETVVEERWAILINPPIVPAPLPWTMEPAQEAPAD